jgi:hypothetical protein
VAWPEHASWPGLGLDWFAERPLNKADQGCWKAALKVPLLLWYALLGMPAGLALSYRRLAQGRLLGLLLLGGAEWERWKACTRAGWAACRGWAARSWGAR